MTTQVKTQKKTTAKTQKKKKTFQKENILIHLETKQQKLVFESLCNALKLSFETHQEKESPYDPEFVKKIERGEEDIKKGRCKEIDINNLWG